MSDKKVTGFSVRPYGSKWTWILWADGCKVVKGNTKHQLTALAVGCLRWAWYNIRKK